MPPEGYAPNFGFEWFDLVDEIDIIKESTESLYEMQRIIDKELNMWAERKKKLNSVLYKRYSEQAKKIRAKDAGVVHLKEEATGIIITANARKEVSYDQEMMITLRNNIIASKDDPDKYIRSVLEISEKTWNSWGIGSWQQNAFLPARTVKIRESFVIVMPLEKKDN